MAFDYSRLTSNPKLGRPIVVAEIGTSHGGDIQRGLDLVDAAAEAGADIAKVQVVFAEEILPPEAGLVPLPGGPTPLYEVFRKLEQPPEFYATLAERAANRGIGFLASPFGEKSVRLLEELRVRAWKVASPELNHEPLLERLAGTGLPMILSTGVSREEDIRRAIEVVQAGFTAAPLPGGRTPAPVDDAPLVLLHCLTNYPAPENQANLLAIPAMRHIFGLPVGLSDHSLDPVLLPVLAAGLGAVMVEKHITLSREDRGLDDPVALTPADFARMTSAIGSSADPGSPVDRKTDDAEKTAARGTDGAEAVEAARLSLEPLIDELSREYGRDRILSCLGDGRVDLAETEFPHYGRTNRSIHAVGALTAGTELTPENTALLRTEKVLRPGIAPKNRKRVYGRRLIADVASGDGITWEDLE